MLTLALKVRITRLVEPVSTRQVVDFSLLDLIDDTLAVFHVPVRKGRFKSVDP